MTKTMDRWDRNVLQQPHRRDMLNYTVCSDNNPMELAVTALQVSDFVPNGQLQIVQMRYFGRSKFVKCLKVPDCGEIKSDSESAP